MKFEEVLQALREGKTVKRQEWISNIFMHIKDGRIYYVNNSDLNPGVHISIGDRGYFLYSDDLLADDWEIVE